MTMVDLGLLLLGAVLIWATAFTGRGRKMDRIEGGGFLLCYAGYVAWLATNL